MQKTYWWRVMVLLFGGMIFGWGYLAVSVSSLKVYNSYTDPLMFLSLSLLIASPFLFFTSDVVFKKWLRFAIIWFILAAIFIMLSPEYSGGFGPSLNPTKESVSIWTGSLFVIISLALIAREKWKTR